MAKINRIRINQAIQNIKHIAYLSELPTANADSADFVSINNVLYAKQVNNGVYSYDEIGGGGVEIISKTIDQNAEPLAFTEDFTQEEFDKLFSGTALLRVWSIANTYGFILKPYVIQSNEVAKGIRFEGFVDIEAGQYFSVDVIQQNGVFRTNIKQIDTKSGANEPTVINLNTYVPNTATNGTLDSSVLQTLQESDQNYIVFNNEIFKLADKQHNEGYLVYSHNGHDTTGCFFQKCITITISTRGWVLEEQENASKSYVDNAIGTALQGDY